MATKGQKLAQTLSQSKEKKDAAAIEQVVAQSNIALQQAQLNNRSAIAQVTKRLNDAKFSGEVIDWNSVVRLQAELNALNDARAFLEEQMSELF